MSNKGKYIDRTPIICPAGKMCERKVSAKDCLQYYRIVDQIEGVEHDLKITDKETFPFHPQRSKSTRHQGIYIESKDLLRSRPMPRYETVINDLRETSYHSYWNKQLGRTRDMNGLLPSGMDPENTVFGKPNTYEYGVKELLNPDKGPFEILLESQEGHELYRKSHNDYNPCERVNRGYITPAYDPDKRYGMNTIYDPKGIWVQCALTWHLDDPLEVANMIQADVAEKKLPKLGKALSPNNNISCVPKDFMFGVPCTREMCGVQELIKDPCCKPCRLKRELYDWIGHLNELRSYVKRRKEVFINLKDLYDSFLFYDKEKTGWLPLEVLYEICKCHRLNFDHTKMESLAKLLEIVKHDEIDYNEFMTLIDVNKPCPKLMKIKDVKPNHEYYITTNMAANFDKYCIDNTVIPVAGTPSVRMDIPRPVAPAGRVKADIESLGDETTAGAIVNPSIFTNYGLSHRDFFMPRQQNYLRKLFENIGYQFPDDTFEKFWNIGVDLDKTGLVCVDTFKKLIARSLQPPEINVEESKCQ